MVNLLEIRRGKRLTGEMISKQIGITQQYYSAIESYSSAIKKGVEKGGGIW